MFNNNSDPISNLKYVKLVVCHEMAHQWVKILFAYFKIKFILNFFCESNQLLSLVTQLLQSGGQIYGTEND